MTRAEVESRMESIVEFSGLREVMDQPFKTYSSGMKARLTFSVAISIDPDVFIVDEALATGDAFFVQKCLKRIKEICESGATVLFVSHATELVKRLCGRALYIDNGRLLNIGDAREICSIYEMLQLDLASDVNEEASSRQGHKVDSPEVRIVDIQPLNAAGRPSFAYFQHDSCALAITLECTEPVVNPAVWVRFTRLDGIVPTSWFSHEPDFHDIGILEPGRHTITVTAEDLLLGDGTYQLTVALFPEKRDGQSAFYTDPLCMWERVVQIEVKRRSRPLTTLFDQPMCITRTAVPSGAASRVA